MREVREEVNSERRFGSAREDGDRDDERASRLGADATDPLAGASVHTPEIAPAVHVEHSWSPLGRVVEAPSHDPGRIQHDFVAGHGPARAQRPRSREVVGVPCASRHHARQATESACATAFDQNTVFPLHHL
jgi:hypothetical protein